MSKTSGAASAAQTQSKIVFERTYRASVEELWDLWTTKDGFEAWWGPVGFRVEVHAMEPRVGGRLAYDMIADAPDQIAAMKAMGQPTSHGAHGTFTELVPRERLVITHVIDFLPGVTAFESTVRVELFPSAGAVRMVVTTDPMPDPKFTEMHRMGFTSQLTKLDTRFGGRAA